MGHTGRYELLRLIARGGMAEVFLARRRAAGVEKLLVVKRIRPERAGDPRFLDMFVREARLSMSLAHQNIVPVFDFGRAGEQVFLAMERVEGKDLGSLLAKVSTLPPLLVAYIGAECCRALAYAHARKGVVHRDVTPRNVLLSWSGEVKLTDFGIAAMTGDPASAVIGTPAYMAPEQARGEQLDARADVYAIGLVLREALTGAKARDPDDALASARINALAAWPDGESGELRAVVERATASAPDDRFADARALLAALDAFIVDKRAANRGESPDHQLAAVLARAFADEPSDEAFSADETVDFEAEDLGAIGTHTEHSMARTAAEVEAPTPAAPAVRRRRWPYAMIPIAAVVAYVAWPRGEVIERPQVGQLSPRAGQTSPHVGQTSPQAGQSSPQVGQASPQVGQPSPQVGQPSPHAGQTSPQVRETSPQVGQPNPEVGRPSPRIAQVSPQLGNSIPLVGQLSPEAGQPSPHVGQTSPQAGQPSPQVGQPSPQVGQPSPQVGQPSAQVEQPSPLVAQPRPRVGDPSPPSVSGGEAAKPAAGPPRVVEKRDATIARAVPVAPVPVAPPAPVPTRRATINATPWAYFTVDGQPAQHTTVETLQLSVGEHRLHFWNPALNVERDAVVQVEPDRDLRFVIPLQ